MAFYIAGQNDYRPHVGFIQMFLPLVLVDPGSVASNRNLGTSISAGDLEGSFAQGMKHNSNIIYPGFKCVLLTLSAIL